MALKAASDESPLETAMLRVPLGAPPVEVFAGPELEHPARTVITVNADATTRMRWGENRAPDFVGAMVNSFVRKLL
jgi:hypothetical protein